MSDGLVRPHRVPRLARGIDHAESVNSAIERLLVARIDGFRTVGEVCADGPFDAVDGLTAVTRLLSSGSIELEEETPGPAFSYFNIDPMNPPADAGKMVPTPKDQTDDADQPTKSGDYFLYMQVDGRTNVDSLASIWGQSVGKTLQGLFELHHRGLVDFSADFKKAHLVTVGGEKERNSELSSESESLFASLALDDFFRAEIWELIPAINSDADMMRLDVERTEGYPLALVDGRHTVGEICELSIRSTSETVAFVLYLFHVGLIRLNPPEELEAPVLMPVAPPTPTPLPELVPIVPAPGPAVEAEAPGGFFEMEWDDDGGSEGAGTAAAAEIAGAAEERNVLLTPPPPAPDEGSDSSYDSMPTMRAVTPAGPDFATVTGVHVLPTSYMIPPHVDRGGGSLASLEGEAVAELLGHVESATTGRVTLTAGGAQRSLWLDAGKLVGVTSNQPAEDLGLALFQAGAIPPEAYGGMEAARRMSGRSCEAVILEQGILAEGELSAHSRAQDTEIVRAAAAAEGVVIEAASEDCPPELFRRPQSLAAVLGHAAQQSASAAGEGFSDPYKVVSAPALKVLLVDHQEQYCQARRSCPPGLLDKEQTLFDYFASSDGGRRLGDVLSNSQLGKTKTRRFLYALYVEGYMVFDPSPGLLLEHEGDEEDLADELERQEEKGLFRRLGLHLTATGEDVEAAYARIAPHYDHSTAAGLAGDVAALVRKIREKLDEAFGRLADDAARRVYRDEICGPPRLAFHAEVEFRRGERLLLSPPFTHGGADLGEAQTAARSASAAFASAHDLQPDEPRFLAYLALAQATEANFDSHPARLQRARLSLERAVSAAPDDATVQAVAARFHKDFGSPDTALQFADKARGLAASRPESQPRLKALGI